MVVVTTPIPLHEVDAHTSTQLPYHTCTATRPLPFFLAETSLLDRNLDWEIDNKFDLIVCLLSCENSKDCSDKEESNIHKDSS